MEKATIPINELARLEQLQALEILDTIEEQSYDDLTAIAAHICDSPICLVSLVDKNRQWFKSHYGIDAHETPRNYAFCAHAILQHEIFEISDSRKDIRFHDNPLVLDEPHVIFYAGFPLTINNHKLGTLCVADNIPKKLSEQQLYALSALGRQVESQMSLRLLNKQLSENNKILHALSSVDPLTEIPNIPTTDDFSGRRRAFETQECTQST
ncbi:MAG: GAF domain-containing protein [Gammaproteobacteria bacterium]